MINLQYIFCNAYEKYMYKYKCVANRTRTNRMGKKEYQPCHIFSALYKFVRNNVYFSRFYDNESGIDGKYLNEIHQFIIRKSFYDSLYQTLLNIYIELTNGITLSELAFDSTFIRNILGTDCCERNPYYNNKTGLKIHIISDQLRVPISVVLSGCTESDALFVAPLIDNLLIDATILKRTSSTILMDSGYESLCNNHYITEKGFELYSGYNKRKQKKKQKEGDKKEASVDELKIYKRRGIVENTFGPADTTISYIDK